MKRICSIMLVLGLVGCAPSVKDIGKKAEQIGAMSLALVDGECVTDPMAKLALLLGIGLPAAQVAEQSAEILKQGIKVPKEERIRVMKAIEELQVPLCKVYDEAVQLPNGAEKCALAIKFNNAVKLCKTTS